MNDVNLIPERGRREGELSNVDYGEMFQQIASLKSKAEVRAVGAVLAAIENRRGATRPAEDFILRVLQQYADEGLTPDDVSRRLGGNSGTTLST
jgi:hypothetical protein